MNIMNEAEAYGFKSMEVPHRSKAGAIIDAFIDSDDESIGKEYEDIQQLMRDMNSMKGYIRNHTITFVRVSKRGNKLILVKK